MPLGDNVLFRDASATNTTGATISVPKPTLAVDGDGINLSLIWWSTSAGGAPFGFDVETTLVTDLGEEGTNYFHSAQAFEVNPGTHWMHHEQVIFTAKTSDTVYTFTLPGDALFHTFGVASAVIPDDAGTVNSGYGQLGAGGPWTDNNDLGVSFGSHGWGALTQGFVEAHIYAAESYTGGLVFITEGDGQMTLGAQDSPAAGRVIFTYWDRPKGMAGNSFLFADFTATSNTSGYYMAAGGSHQGDYPPRAAAVVPQDVEGGGSVYVKRHTTSRALPYELTTGRLEGVPWHEIGE